MRHILFFFAAGAVTVAVACGTNGGHPFDTGGGLPADAGGGSGGSSSSGGAILPPDDSSVGSLLGDVNAAEAMATTTMTSDPTTCAEAAQAHTYVGCDYWPTVVANNVWSIFDFAVVVANAGTSMASVTVTGPPGTNSSSTNVTATVPPGQLSKIYLPWVVALKGLDSDNCGTAQALPTSVIAPAGAFHLVSSVPVTVYQFNALEYRGQGGPPGKSWSSCPGNTACVTPTGTVTVGCFSFSNDASLLLPSTAMTGNYRVAGHEGVVILDQATGTSASLNGTMSITATQNATTVNVRVANAAAILAGPRIARTPGGGTLTLSLNAGDVAELVAENGTDLSGSIVQATNPVQVITGHPCIQVPPAMPACDHIEESVFPAETWGKDYVVTRPAGPAGTAVPHQVRFYGNFNGTHLTYNPATPPPGCPTTLNAGQVVECGTPACPAQVNLAVPANCGTINQDFEVTGDQPFAVGTFTLGATVVDPNMTEGDPAQSFPTAVEQYRSKYVFLAPDDYVTSYVDIVARPGVAMTLDGQGVTTPPQTVTTGYSVYRVRLGAGQAGAHVLDASQRVGIQVVGYGAYTSYMVPGGLDLVRIAPPPPIQ